MTPVFFEPAHLRGRPQASFSNSLFPGLNSSQSYLVGAISSPVAQQSLYLATIWEYSPVSLDEPDGEFLWPLALYDRARKLPVRNVD